MGMASEVYVDSTVVWSHQASPRSTWAMVELVADGMRGVGELSDGAPLDTLVAAARSMSSIVIGLPLGQARSALRRRLEELRAAGDAQGAFLWSTVLGGYEAAFADLLARLDGRALSTSLGLGEPRPVRLYANLNRRYGGDGPDVIVAEAMHAASNGFPALKVACFLDNHARGLSGGRLIDAGLDLVARVREAIPSTVQLMVDCHHLVAANLVDVSDRPALEAAAATGLSLAAGEHIWDPEVAAAACATGALQYWLADPKHAGGPAGVVRIAEAVEGVQLTFHNPSGPVGTAHAAHLAGLAGPTTWLEFGWGEADRTGFLEPAETVAAGFMQPTGPGIGCRPRGGPVTTTLTPSQTGVIHGDHVSNDR